MSYRIDISFGDVNKVKNECVDKSKLALFKLSDNYLSRLKQDGFMPFDYGTMQNTNTYLNPTTPNSSKYDIITDAVQARRLYYHPEYNFQKGHNSNAGGLWHEREIEYMGGEAALIRDFMSLLGD